MVSLLATYMSSVKWTSADYTRQTFICVVVPSLHLYSIYDSVRTLKPRYLGGYRCCRLMPEPDGGGGGTRTRGQYIGVMGTVSLSFHVVKTVSLTWCLIQKHVDSNVSVVFHCLATYFNNGNRDTYNHRQLSRASATLK